jgi:hypothetical protein
MNQSSRILRDKIISKAIQFIFGVMLQDRSLNFLLIDAERPESYVYRSLGRISGVTPYMTDGIFDMVAEVAAGPPSACKNLSEKVREVHGVSSVIKMRCEEIRLRGNGEQPNPAYPLSPQRFDAGAFVIVQPTPGHINDGDSIVRYFYSCMNRGLPRAIELYRTDYAGILAKLACGSNSELSRMRDELRRMKCVQNVIGLKVL